MYTVSVDGLCLHLWKEDAKLLLNYVSSTAKGIESLFAYGRVKGLRGAACTPTWRSVPVAQQAVTSMQRLYTCTDLTCTTRVQLLVNFN